LFKKTQSLGDTQPMLFNYFNKNDLKVIGMRKNLIVLSFLIFPIFIITAQNLKLSVVDGISLEGLPSVLIYEQVQNKTWVTDLNGNVEIPLTNLSSIQKLEFSFLGYQNQVYNLPNPIPLNSEVVIKMSSIRSQLQEVVISSTRVRKDGVFAKQDISKEEISQLNLGQDLPILINQATSVVTSTDAGNGIGYTGIRVRGTDPTRINVTINGIPVNDAESQSVYWVNMPDLASTTESIQIQRGVGTSSNGQGAFGATINLQTSILDPKPSVQLHSSVGSFNTFRNTIQLGTGLIDEKWAFDARFSKISSDGYIDRATTDLQSQYLSGGYYGKNDIIKFVYFGGKEKTYQAWNGVAEENLTTNRTYNYTGEFTDASGNRQFYDNETDNYWQDNFQLHWSKYINAKFNVNTSLHYTRGKGYFEQYRENDRFSSYNLENIILTDGNSISRSDLVRRRWLDNHFGGFVFSGNYLYNAQIDFTVGGGYNIYDGDHFGQVIWARFISNGNTNHEYYRDNARKNDSNLYGKINYNLNDQWSTFLDLQVRHLDYRFVGFNEELRNDDQQVNYLFFNPKAGVSYKPNAHSQFFGSYSVGSREPNRRDFTRSSPDTRPKPEYLYDLELGWRAQQNSLNYAVTLYNMNYKDQLILTGQINDVGDYTRVNVDKSVRRGIEMEVAYQVNKKVGVAFNSALSSNKISEFKEFLDDYDTDFNYLGQQQETYKNVDIAFSPNVISALSLQYSPVSWFDILINNKYVGRQFLDNTQNVGRSINPYFTTDIKFAVKVKTPIFKDVQFNLLVNNLWNSFYENNGYTYGYLYEGRRDDFNFYFPQAGVNGLMGVSIKL
jgi:iron complex outermembrane recepter protein